MDICLILARSGKVGEGGGGGGGGGEEMAKCVRHKTINLFFHMNVNSPRKK